MRNKPYLLLLYLFCFVFSHAEGTMFFKFNAKDIGEFEGTIVTVRLEHWYHNKKENMVAVVKTKQNATHHVDLGPAFLYKEKPTPGQHIVVTGAIVLAKGRTYCLTTRVSINYGSFITIRNHKGKPVWFNGGKSKFHYQMNRMKRMKKMH